MSLRRAGTLVAALALTACHTVTQEAQPADLVFATFNSTTGVIPIPNDLVIQKAATATASASLPQAQIEVLKGYAKSGGFPSDVEVAITIPFHKVHWDAAANGGNGAYLAAAAPTFDATTVTGNVVLHKVDTGSAVAVPFDVVLSAGKITLRPKAVGAVRRWAGGRYVVTVRGGATGLKTSDGMVVNADQTISLAARNVDLTIKENQPPGFPAALGAQLNGLTSLLWNRLNWQASASGAWSPVPDPQVVPAFSAAGFPASEVAVVAAFGIDKSAHVALDSSAGQVPFPSDFLLERTVANCPTGVAPCIVNNPAFGAAASGLRTLDGFSTSALLLAPLTGAVDASTITYANVHVFDVTSNPAVPARLKDLASTLPSGAGAAYATQPSQFNQTVGSKSLTTTMALAPGQLADLTALGLGRHALPPLKEKTTYVVLVTRRVLNADGSAMTRGAVANILLSTGTNPLWANLGGTDVALVSGPDAASAKGLQTLRDGLNPLLTALPALTGGATTRDDVVMAYTVTTQSVTGTSLSLASAPYSIEKTTNLPIFAGSAIAAVTVPAGVPTTGISGFYRLTFNTADLIDKSTGALRPTLASDLASPSVLPTLLTPLHALVAVPNAANVPACGAGFPAGAKCAKLVVVGHGINGSNSTVFALASALASQGFVVAGIDYPLHGERNWCGADADCVNTTTGADGTCDKTGAFAASAGQGDAVRPGVCSAGSVPKTAGSRYLISANFFRTRDTFRQNLFDVAALELAVSRPPTMPQPASSAIGAVLPAGVIVDPTAVYYEGISWGAIGGTSVMATHPRITRGALSVGGATLVDTFTSSPSFQASLDALFPSIIPGWTRAKVTPGNAAFDAAMAATYLQLLQVAKWILDPGDPINYAGRVRNSPLPDLLTNPAGTVAQAPKSVFAQIAKDDDVVPNANNYLLDLLLGGEVTLYTSATGGAAPHGMLGSNAQVQADAALYLVDPATNIPPATRALTF